MRYLATPKFSEKVLGLPSSEVAPIVDIVKEIGSLSKEQLEVRAEIIDADGGVYVLRRGGARVLLSFGADDEGEYALIVDVLFHTSPTSDGEARPYKSRDPRFNPMVDPNRNMMIDPRRNMMIDPRRNMMIDPNRNMMIDPRRNMMIDPHRNMMIDPNRNMTIDPRRNYLLDPLRNWSLGPIRNRAWSGQYLYDPDPKPAGFIASANEKVRLVFDLAGKFKAYAVSNEAGGFNLFEPNATWIEHWTKANDDVLLRFTPQNQWVGVVL